MTWALQSNINLQLPYDEIGILVSWQTCYWFLAHRFTEENSGMKDQEKYVAFLRGINLGKRNIKMAELAQVFAKLGCEQVLTVLASGNVIFLSTAELTQEQIQQALQDEFGFEISVVIRSISHLQSLIEKSPFADYEGKNDVKFYATFSDHSIGNILEEVTGIEGDFDLVQVREYEYFCVAFKQATGRFGAGLSDLEKLFKHQIITTRNWNTVLKIIKKSND